MSFGEAQIDNTADFHGFSPDAIAALIERQIIPELLALNSDKAPRPPAADGLVLAIAQAASAGDSALVERYIDDYVETGVDFATAMSELISAAARQLGLDWENDTRDFFDVTLGLGTLQSIVGRYAASGGNPSSPDHTILLCRTPGEDHSLGLCLVNYHFQLARWYVDFRPYAETDEIIDAVSTNYYSIVGLSMASESFAPKLADLIKGIRKASRNPNTRIMVGGPAVLRDPGLATHLKADDTANDGRSAVLKASRWLDPTQSLVE